MNEKFGLYFDTKSHGGDNFKFRATNDTPFFDPFYAPDCLITAEPTEIFTVWRKIYLDYAFMEDRGDNYPDPDCYGTHDESILKEFRGVHKLDTEEEDESKNVTFNMIKGAFDDSFIEIIKAANPYQADLPYRSFLISYDYSSDLVDYGDLTGFRPNPPLDTILLMGIDHFNTECYHPPGGYQNGSGVQHWKWYKPSDAFYSYVGVGVTHDALRNGKKVITLEDDQRTGASYWKIIGFTATHELGHSLLQRGNSALYEFPYGVMNPDDRRSYFHSGHIIFLRGGSTKFDQTIY